MARKTELAVAATLGLVAVWVGWGAYSKRSLDAIPFTTLASVDGVEIREYPEGVIVETTASTETEATDRLHRYLAGANEPRAAVTVPTAVGTGAEVTLVRESLAAPVRTGGDPVEATPPVRTATTNDRVTVGRFLRSDYSVETAPAPTNPLVTVRRTPRRTLAVRPFSWVATDGRTRDQRAALLTTLDDSALVVTSDPVLFRYDSPLTPPFLRHNEVAVELAAA
ncbi:SOUL family heme-binding protein [Halomarina oriensis]|uniref:Heme-binding protein n=1 Tax=Halomarina oriensis TaxID=671145 RepID=A0A6B0GJY0_9EURY|nr:heme-binding protein [Halomarina oriensis]MWG35226.1 heme-binding protein [Halomarina oriensis]